VGRSDDRSLATVPGSRFPNLTSPLHRHGQTNTTSPATVKTGTSTVSAA
jgi:hypothetical protein